jgi:hypothetical protein
MVTPILLIHLHRRRVQRRRSTQPYRATTKPNTLPTFSRILQFTHGQPSNADLAKMIEQLTGFVAMLQSEVTALKRDKEKTAAAGGGGVPDG